MSPPTGDDPSGENTDPDRVNTATSPSVTSNDPARFFEELGERGNEPLLRKVAGSIRFEIVDGDAADSWMVVVDHGRLTVTHQSGPADCTIRGDRSTYEDLVAGRTNANAAVLRGALAARGDVELLVTIQRIFPSPPPGWDPTAETRGSS